jgi:hypothetical protein
MGILPLCGGIIYFGVFRKGYRMNRIILKTGLAVLMAVLLTVCGCGKKADANKPIPEVKAEAEKMDVTQLRDTAMKYKDVIAAKLDEVKTEGLKLKDLPMAEIAGEKAKAINATIDQIKKDIDALTERLNIYIEELKKKGGDISGL